MNSAQSAAPPFAPAPANAQEFGLEIAAAESILPIGLRWAAFARSALERGWELLVAFGHENQQPGAEINGAGAPPPNGAPPNAPWGANNAAADALGDGNPPEAAALAAMAPLTGSLYGVLGDAA